MNLLAIFTILSVPALTVQDLACLDDKVILYLLAENKVTSDITSLLKGKTFVDVWRRKETADLIDCAVTTFTLDNGKLKAKIHSVEQNGVSDYYDEVWLEVKGQGRMHAEGNYIEDEKIVTYKVDYNIFYVDEFAYGYYSCDADLGSTARKRMSIGIVQDKQKDEKALKSLEKARVIMERFKYAMPDTMVKLTRTKCPSKA